MAYSFMENRKVIQKNTVHFSEKIIEKMMS